ncbi:MAG: UrcA family protein [Caulobacterales bacterium]|nr:UrcA family protein [Caulobacterales bacterium]
MKRPMMLIAAAAALAAAGTAPALAGEFEFRFRSSELATHEARAAVLDRLTEEARRRCAKEWGAPMIYNQLKRRCRADLVDDALAEIADARLSAQWNDRETRPDARGLLARRD